MSNENLKKELKELLDDENVDYTRLLEVSSKLAASDDENVRFSIDAGLIDRLGKELVGRHETAVSELVKNTYDADSTYVELVFENSDKPGGTLYIDDDGHGMTREQLIDGFMRISSSDKVHNPISPKYKRKRAGRKGIGRFATQRLSERLIVTTQTKNADHTLKVTVNWADFSMDKNLMSIANKIESVPKLKEEGTTLILEGLRDSWSLAEIKRVFRYVGDLLQPFPLSKKLEKSDQDPGFKYVCKKRDGEGDISVADEETMFFEHALAEIEGYVLENGQGFWSWKSKKLGVKEEVQLIGKDRENSEIPYDKLKNIHFKAHYFIYKQDLIPKQSETFILEAVKEQSGIRLYRNGFRVLPYGEPENDWLGLDASIRKRSVLPVHGNRNLLGFIEVIDSDGNLFEETASREGLIENIAFDELKDFVYRVILSLVQKIADIRGVKKKSGQKGWEKKEKDAPEKIKEIAEELSLRAKGAEGKREEENQEEQQESHKRSEEFHDFSQRLLEAAEEVKDEKKELLEEIQMLRVLASLGLSISQFIHEIKHRLAELDADVGYFIETTQGEGQEHALRLKENFNLFNNYTSYFDEVVSKNVQRDVFPQEMRMTIRAFIDTIQPDLLRSGIQADEPDFKGYDLFTCPMHPSEWASILFNLYTNAKKALALSGNVRKMKIVAGVENKKIYLEFSDNGIGIPEENHERVFDAFFTTTSPAGLRAKEIDENTGTGLGLKITSDIIVGYNGEIFVSKAAEGFTTCFRIELPQATEEELEKYDV